MRADLERAQGLTCKVHPDPIDPQFRIATQEGDYGVSSAAGQLIVLV